MTIQEIAAIAEACANCATRPSLEAWQALSSEAYPAPATARVEDGWLLVRVAAPPAAERRPAWDLLRLNATAGRSARLALDPHDRCVVVLADVPLDDDVDLAGRFADASGGMRALMHVVGGDFDGAACSSEGASGVEPADDIAPGALSAVLQGSAWSFVERSSHRLAVDLDIPGRFSQAVVEARGGRCLASVRLQSSVALSARSREALGLMLLTLTGTLKMVKASVDGSNGAEVPALAIDLPGLLTPAELHHALAALSVACHEIGAETRVLNSEEIAEAYLAARARRSR
jgi:hypothetical protein